MTSYLTRLLPAWLLLVMVPELGAADRLLLIGSWNIEGASSSSPVAVAEYLQLSRSGILVLQGVPISRKDHRPSPKPLRAAPKSDLLDEALGQLDAATDSSWSYELFPIPETSELATTSGIVWDDRRVLKVGDTYKLPVSDVESDMEAGMLWRNPPYAIHFSDRTTNVRFILITVHMASNSDGVEVGESRRSSEAEQLVACLPTVRTQFPNVPHLVIAGDTNMLRATERAAESIVRAGFRDTNSDDVSTYVSGPPYTRFFVPSTIEFQSCQQYILQPTDADEYADRLSRHLMSLLSLSFKHQEHH